MTAPKFCIKQDHGFTLLEVMVAMVVLALVLVTLLQLHSGTIQLAGAGKFKGMIPLLAGRQLAALTADPDAPYSLSGDFGQGYEGLEWTASIEDAVFEEPAALSEPQAGRLKKIRIDISSPKTGRSHTITTWRYLVETDD
ncbi:MAG: prepilin-type N-terminal cleavage/methylation domain-containing protein [Desulfotignum sp.]|nr:prepilin-type N-terminal cleavage/methylation domain-containing protein [Desulfobacteraceae bacterium]